LSWWEYVLRALPAAGFVALLLFSFVGRSIVRRYRDWWLLRRLRRETARPVATLPEGQEVKVVGRARALDETLTAPLSGRACVYYEAKARTTSCSGRDEGFPDECREARGVPFVIDDGSAQAVVDPTGAVVLLEVDHRSEDRTAQNEALLHRHGLTFDERCTYEFAEAVIEIGETVAVSAVAAREPNGRGTGGAYRLAPTTVRLLRTPQTPVVVSDRAPATEK